MIQAVLTIAFASYFWHQLLSLEYYKGVSGI